MPNTASNCSQLPVLRFVNEMRKAVKAQMDREGKVYQRKTGRPSYLVRLRNDIIHNTSCTDLKQERFDIIPVMLKIVKVSHSFV